MAVLLLIGRVQCAKAQNQLLIPLLHQPASLKRQADVLNC